MNNTAVKILWQQEAKASFFQIYTTSYESLFILRVFFLLYMAISKCFSYKTGNNTKDPNCSYKGQVQFEEGCSIIQLLQHNGSIAVNCSEVQVLHPELAAFW